MEGRGVINTALVKWELGVKSTMAFTAFSTAYVILLVQSSQEVVSLNGLLTCGAVHLLKHLQVKMRACKYSIS